MKRSTDRILTTHVGSLVRPPLIVEAMRASESGVPYDEGKFSRDLSAAVVDVVRLSQRSGSTSRVTGSSGSAAGIST